MKVMNKTTILTTLLVSCLFFSACGKKTNTIDPLKNKTQDSQPAEFNPTEKPNVSLIPREDGHELKLKISNIASDISRIEYELIYKAQSEGSEIEKGVGDTIKDIQKSIEKDLLLGTASCTNGCKYKYDEGVTGGSLNLILINSQNQTYSMEMPFVLKQYSDFKKTNTISIADDDFSAQITPKKGQVYLMIKGDKNYSLFTNLGLNKEYPISSQSQ